MSAGDGTNPPVLFVVGTAGAGKSTLVTAFQRWARFLEVDVLAVNLDPGAERVHYDTEYDVRDLVSLSDVMDEYDLGPNGAQILAADLVAAQAYDIQDELDGLSGDLLIIDPPGQVELFAFREASNHLVEVLGQDRSALIFLFDPMLSRSASGFVSQMLLSNIVHFRLGQPTANFLSKADLLEPDDLERVLEWGERLDVLEAALFDAAVQPGDAVMIGDTSFDMEMAVAAGVRAIGVAWGYHEPSELLQTGASAVAETMEGLEDMIRG